MKPCYKKFFRCLEVLIMFGLIFTVYNYRKQNDFLFQKYAKLKTGSDYVVNYQSDQITKLRNENSLLNNKLNQEENQNISINKEEESKVSKSDNNIYSLLENYFGDDNDDILLASR